MSFALLCHDVHVNHPKLPLNSGRGDKYPRYLRAVSGNQRYHMNTTADATSGKQIKSEYGSVINFERE